MNKKLYSILFFVPLIVCLLAMTVVTGCSDDDEPLQSTYALIPQHYYKIFFLST